MSAAKRAFPRGTRALEQTQAWYDKVYADALAGAGPYSQPWNRCPNRTVTWYPALLMVRGRVVEIGCGAGRFAEMARTFGIEYVCGIETSRAAVQLSRKNVPGAVFQRVDLRKTPDAMLTLAFDTVVILEVLEHIHDDLGLLGVVPTGKTVVASVPSFHTEGHVRWFASEKQVRMRYDKLLDLDLVVEERGHKSSNQWWIFRGTKR